MKKNRIITGTIVALGVILVISLISWYVIKPAEVILQGEVEVRSIKISSKLTGRVDSLAVREGEPVVQGQLLFVLSTPEVEAKLRQANAARNAAGAQESKAMNGARIQEIDAAFNMWQKAKAGLELAKKTYERAQNLYKDGVIPTQKLDEAEANFKAMQTTAKAAKSQYEMAKEGARKEDKTAARALVDQASGVISEIESVMSDSRQYSPVNGEVGTVIAEQGELISAGYPVVTVLDMSDMWISFNVKETLMPKLKMGTVMKAYLPALDKTVDLKIDYIAAQADYATWSATKTTGDFDIKTFEVRARPVDPQSGLRPGMSAVVNWTGMKK